MSVTRVQGGGSVGEGEVVACCRKHSFGRICLLERLEIRSGDSLFDRRTFPKCTNPVRIVLLEL